jgi:hypothetical protein
MDLKKLGWELDWEAVGWIHLAQDRDQWWADMNTIVNFQVL